MHQTPTYLTPRDGTDGHQTDGHKEETVRLHVAPSFEWQGTPTTPPTSNTVHPAAPVRRPIDVARRKVMWLAALALVLTAMLGVLVFVAMRIPTSAMPIAAAAAEPPRGAAMQVATAPPPVPVVPPVPPVQAVPAVPVVAAAPAEPHENPGLGQGEAPRTSEKTARAARPLRVKA